MGGSASPCSPTTTNSSTLIHQPEEHGSGGIIADPLSLEKTLPRRGCPRRACEPPIPSGAGAGSYVSDAGEPVPAKIESHGSHAIEDDDQGGFLVVHATRESCNAHVLLAVLRGILQLDCIKAEGFHQARSQSVPRAVRSSPEVEIAGR